MFADAPALTAVLLLELIPILRLAPPAMRTFELLLIVKEPSMSGAKMASGTVDCVATMPQTAKVRTS